MGGRIFECLDAVINRYRKEQIVEGYTLQHPVSYCCYVFIMIIHDNYSDDIRGKIKMLSGCY